MKKYNRTMLAAAVAAVGLVGLPAAQDARAEVVQEKVEDAAGYRVTFRLDATEWDDKPNSVHVAGDFNGWNAGANPMTDADGDGVWTATLPLSAGEYGYKFVIDGDRWITDPTDDPELRKGDNYGGENSGVIVGPDIRKAPPPEPNAINAEFVRHDPATDVTQVDDGTAIVRVRALAGDVQEVGIAYTAIDGDGEQLAFGILPPGKRGTSTGGYDVFELPLKTVADGRSNRGRTRTRGVQLRHIAQGRRVLPRSGDGRSR